MNRRSRTLFSTFVLSTLLVPSALAQVNRRISVLRFTLGQQAADTLRKNFGMNSTLGSDLSGELTAELTRSRKFDIVEQAELNAVMKVNTDEQSFKFDANTVAQLGKMNGVNDVILGDVTELSGQVKHGGFGPYTNDTTTVTVRAVVRVVDTSTGKVVASGSGEGTAVDTQKHYNINANGQRTNNSSGSFGNGLLNKASSMAIAQIAKSLVEAPELGPVQAPPRATYKGVVAYVKGNSIIFTLPKNSSAKTGDAIQVTRVVGEVTDPDNPKIVLRKLTDTITSGTITEVDAATSTATATISGGGVKIKDEVVYKP